MSGDLQVRDRPGVQTYAQSAMDARIAARWLSVRREQNRRRRRVARGALVAVTALAGVWILARSPLLGVHHLEVRGNTRTPRAAVLAAAGLAGHPPMLKVDVDGIRRRDEALPWVARVSAQRHWPSTVAIAITERLAVATINGPGGQPAVIDVDGRVMAAGKEASLVLRGEQRPLAVLLGLPPAGPAGTTVARDAQGALTVLQALQTMLLTNPPGLESEAAGARYVVTAVRRAGDGTLTASLSSLPSQSPAETNVVFGSTDQMAAKLVALRSVFPQVAPGAAATIDVRVAEAPVLTSGPKRSNVSTTQRG